MEFLDRVLDQVPETGQQLLSYRGFYSNAALGRRLRQPGESSTAPRSVTDPRTPMTPSVAGAGSPGPSSS